MADGIQRVINGDDSAGKGRWRKRMPSCNEVDRDCYPARKRADFQRVLPERKSGKMLTFGEVRQCSSLNGPKDGRKDVHGDRNNLLDSGLSRLHCKVHGRFFGEGGVVTRLLYPTPHAPPATADLSIMNIGVKKVLTNEHLHVIAHRPQPH